MDKTATADAVQYVGKNLQHYYKLIF